MLDLSLNISLEVYFAQMHARIFLMDYCPVKTFVAFHRKTIFIIIH